MTTFSEKPTIKILMLCCAIALFFVAFMGGKIFEQHKLQNEQLALLSSQRELNKQLLHHQQQLNQQLKQMEQHPLTPPTSSELSSTELSQLQTLNPSFEVGYCGLDSFQELLDLTSYELGEYYSNAETAKDPAKQDFLKKAEQNKNKIDILMKALLTKSHHCQDDKIIGYL